MEENWVGLKIFFYTESRAVEKGSVNYDKKIPMMRADDINLITNKTDNVLIE